MRKEHKPNFLSVIFCKKGICIPCCQHLLKKIISHSSPLAFYFYFQQFLKKERKGICFILAVISEGT